jgi:hypothetical protein
MENDTKPSVYIETSIISYLTARPPRDIVGAARQQLTQDWWENDKHNFELFVSETVQDEASQGNPEAAQKRLNAIKGIPNLEMADEIITELWKIKDESAAAVGYNLRKRFDQLKRLEIQSKVPVVNRCSKQAQRARTYHA